MKAIALYEEWQETRKAMEALLNLVEGNNSDIENLKVYFFAAYRQLVRFNTLMDVLNTFDISEAEE